MATARARPPAESGSTAARSTKPMRAATMPSSAPPSRARGVVSGTSARTAPAAAPSRATDSIWRSNPSSRAPRERWSGRDSVRPATMCACGCVPFEDVCGTTPSASAGPVTTVTGGLVTERNLRIVVCEIHPWVRLFSGKSSVEHVLLPVSVCGVELSEQVMCAPCFPKPTPEAPLPPRAAFREGVRRGLPFAAVGFVLSLSFGVLARQAGFTALQAMVRRPGLRRSAQFAALSIVVAGGGVGRRCRRQA